MKKLLLALLCVASAYGYSQATANPAPDLVQCNSEVFDLTAQTSIILGNQPAPQFTVTYFETMTDANANASPISTPTTYVALGMSQEIYARVDNTSDGSFAVTSFGISWGSVLVGEYPDIAVCDSWITPELPPNTHFYSAPGASISAMIPAGFAITSTQTLYVALSQGDCISETSFVLTVYNTPSPPSVSDVTACDSYVLPSLPMGSTYHWESGGSPTTIIPSGVVIVVTSEIFVFSQTGTIPNCTTETSFMVTITQTPVVDYLPDVTTCASYTLPELSGLSTYYTGPGGTGTQLAPGTAITTSMTIYIFAQTSGTPNCMSQSEFTVTITDGSIINILPGYSACESYVLPVLDSGNYYTAPNGTGNLVAAGSGIFESTDIYIYSQVGECWTNSMFHVNIGTPVILPQEPVIVCDSDQDGFATFDLSPAATAINTGVSNVAVSFYETMTDATVGANPVSFEYHNIIANAQTLYYRLSVVNDNNCFSIGELQLQTVDCPSISGVVRFDADTNGCTDADGVIANAQVALIAGNTIIYAYTNQAGEYTFPNLAFGNYYISLVNVTIGNSVGATNVVVATNTDYTANFCITPVVPTNDIVTYVWPTNNARPGFPAGYAVQVYNAGSTVQTGTVTFDYDDTKLNFTSASPAPASQSSGQLVFNFANLGPGSYAYYYVWLMVETPPTANIGEIISFAATAESALVDATPSNNTATTYQMLVDSYDPNDKTVLQETFLNDDTQNYLRYIVRFQNTGSAEAVNVRITDQLDQNLDWSTFRPVSSSHNYSAHLNESGLVTFNFDNINLPDSTTNEPASHGFVTYEVKLKSGLTVNEDVYNTANIYFDFNAPIVTNTVMTDLVNLLGVGDHSLSSFVLYPNPASHIVNIDTQLQGGLFVTVFDIHGKLVLETAGENQAMFDVSMLSKGMYFVKVVSGNAVETKKFLVR
jgi:uncharacterized repeat protein (TIGR01451 family)